MVAGYVSEFGVGTPGDSSDGQTADGGTTARPCIAILEDATLDHWFQVTLYSSRGGRMIGHPAKLLHCDVGPASWTERSIDVTGAGVEALGLSPDSFPTSPPAGTWAVARELR